MFIIYPSAYLHLYFNSDSCCFSFRLHESTINQSALCVWTARTTLLYVNVGRFIPVSVSDAFENDLLAFLVRDVAVVSSGSVFNSFWSMAGAVYDNSGDNLVGVETISTSLDSFTTISKMYCFSVVKHATYAESQ